MLEAKNLTFRYGARPLVDDFSLRLRPGDFTMLLGPNGSGKSTLLKLLAGFLTPQQGNILFKRRPLQDVSLRERARTLAVVMQNAPPVLNFTAREMVMLGRNARLSRLTPPTPHDREAVATAMAQLQITDLAAAPCNQLSGGERQRVMLAAALAAEPEVLLLDEPTSALDPAHALAAMHLLTTLPGAPAVLMVSHDLQLAARYARQLLLFRDGRVLAAGSPQSVLTPANLRAVYGCNAEILYGSDGVPQVALRE